MTSTPKPRPLPLQLTLRGPVPGVAYALQKKDGSLVAPESASNQALSFVLVVDVLRTAEGFDFRGPFVHGPRGDRFLYVNSGRRAGQPFSGWDRRAKLKLGAIPAHLLEAAPAGAPHVVFATFAASGDDGGPFCATRPPEPPGWARKSSPPLADPEA